ncbi:MAG: prepilin-type N-terminal cleavage/methylation domain-containing protein [Thermoanaerobaculia bacterium]
MCRKNVRGFTLIELLIVVGIIGILAAIAVPNLLSAVQRAKQKRTMADIRTIAGAWEAREVDMTRYNAAGWSMLGFPVEHSQLTGAIYPTYLRKVPSVDGWGNPWAIATSAAWSGPGRAHAYQIVSGGRDGAISPTTESGPTTHFDCDIVYQEGAFLLYPEGVQTGK